MIVPSLFQHTVPNALCPEAANRLSQETVLAVPEASIVSPHSPAVPGQTRTDSQHAAQRHHQTSRTVEVPKMISSQHGSEGTGRGVWAHNPLWDPPLLVLIQKSLVE